MPTGDTEYDVIVVGAGMAGVACAGELVADGLRTLLVCETPDVGWNMRPVVVDGNIGFVQHPIWQVAFGGGWWAGLARRLNAPVHFHVSPPLDLLNRGTGERHELSFCTSAAALMELFQVLSPVPLDAVKDDFERVLGELLQIPWRDLVELNDTPLSQWLDDHDANPALKMIFFLMFANFLESSPVVMEQHLSAFGAIGMLRSLVCGEGPVTAVEPDNRAGLLLPLCAAIEARGGTIWRGRKVARVLIEDGQAAGVELHDGTVARARAVALATGTTRVPALVQPVPDDVTPAVDYARSLDGEDVCTFTVLAEPVVDIEHLTMVADVDGSNLAFLFPMHAIGRWTTQPGKQFLAAQAFFTPDRFEALGGLNGVVKHMLDLQEELFPGFAKAAEKTEVQQHKYKWVNPLFHGPKLPSQCASIAGLWFAGDGSKPVGGLGVDGAASAGILRARQIRATLEGGDPTDIWPSL